DSDKATAILRQLEKEIDAVRFDPGDGSKIELPVKLRVYDSLFVPLAKWAMLLAGNYRCVTKDGMRTAQEAVHSDIETSRSVYNFVNDLCVKLGAQPADLVPFEKYAAAAQSLVRPASAGWRPRLRCAGRASPPPSTSRRDSLRAWARASRSAATPCMCCAGSASSQPCAPRPSIRARGTTAIGRPARCCSTWCSGN